MAGQVLVNDRVMDKAGSLVEESSEPRIRGADIPYVSRGGLKLEKGLDEFRIMVAGAVALDVGASTGGFTDCLLQRGAARVYAVDVGYGQLAWKLRTDPRVVSLEKTNIRGLTTEKLGAVPDLAVIDASFISLQKVLPPTLALLGPEAVIVALIKPQFEAGREQVGKGGVVRDPKVHQRVIEEVCDCAAGLGLAVLGVTESPITGPKGNREYLVALRKGGVAGNPVSQE
jgi:23S rRNA (cytidine1920-2'-O)/16S rRNA (cytidine1409-2'-O)-methyltransferase